MVIQLKNPHEFKVMLTKLGYTQKSFAKKADTSSGYVNQIISGVKKPGPAIAKKFTDALDVTFDDIFFIKDDN